MSNSVDSYLGHLGNGAGFDIQHDKTTGEIEIYVGGYFMCSCDLSDLSEEVLYEIGFNN